MKILLRTLVVLLSLSSFSQTKEEMKERKSLSKGEGTQTQTPPHTRTRTSSPSLSPKLEPPLVLPQNPEFKNRGFAEYFGLLLDASRIVWVWR